MTEAQGRHFLDLQPGLEVTGIIAQGGKWQVKTNRGQGFQATSFVLAPGLRRRRLNVPGENHLAGAGVHTCANCEGPKCAGKDIVVVDVGNSGIEQALSLADFAKSVTVVAKSPGVRCSRERYQIAKAHPNIVIKLNSAVREFKGGRILSSVLIENTKTGNVEEMNAAAAFISIGLEPATSAFRTSVGVDRDGFISSNRNMQTNSPEIFAAGHARSRRVQSPEDAVSEGYRATAMVRKFLDNARR